MDWIKIISRWVFTNFLLAILLLSFFGISSSFAFFFLKDKLKWERYDFGDKTQEEKAKIVENIISSAIPDSIVAKLQSVKLNQCILTIETKYLRPCKTKYDRTTVISSEKILDLTELSDNISYDVKISLPDEHLSYSFLHWQFKPNIAKELGNISAKISAMLDEQIMTELRETGRSVGGEERLLKYSKIREQAMNQLGVRSRTIDQTCEVGKLIGSVSSNFIQRLKPSQAKVALSSLATYKLEYCSAKSE